MLGSRSMASNRRKVGFVNKNIHSCLSKLRGKFRETERSSIRSSNVHIYRIFDKTFVWFKLLCSSERCVSSKKGRWTSNIIIDAEIFLLIFFAKYLSDDNVIYLGLNRFKYLQLTRSPDYFAFINQLQLLAVDLYSPWLRTAKFCRMLCYVTKASIGTYTNDYNGLGSPLPGSSGQEGGAGGHRFSSIRLEAELGWAVGWPVVDATPGTAAVGVALIEKISYQIRDIFSFFSFFLFFKPSDRVEIISIVIFVQ